MYGNVIPPVSTEESASEDQGTRQAPSSEASQGIQNVPEYVAEKCGALPAWFRSIRMNQGMELRWAARQSGLSAGQISRLENKESSLTIFSLLKLCHGLKIDAIAVAKQLDIAPNALQKREKALLRSPSNTALTSSLISRLYQAYQENPKSVSGRFRPWLSEFGIPTKSPFIGVTAYPVGVSAQTVYQAYIQGDSLILEDAGAFIRSWREAKGWKIEELAKQAGMSFGPLQKFETGIIKRLKFENIVALNLITSAEYDDAFFGICWSAGAFYLGIHNIKEDEEKVTLPAWKKEEWAFAEAMVKLTRTAQIRGQREVWLRELTAIVG